MGSGSLAAMSVFESRFEEDMDEASAIALVKDAIRAGIFNDLGSGSNVDITVIRKGGDVSRHRTYEVAAGKIDDYKAKYTKPESLSLPLGSTLLVESSFKPSKKTPPTVLNSLTEHVESMEVV